MIPSLDMVAEISRAIARKHHQDLRVTAVTLTEGSIHRVEVLVTLEERHREPCRFLINVARTDRANLEKELGAKLDDALSRHVVRS